jgi:hypothetical protein
LELGRVNPERAIEIALAIDRETRFVEQEKRAKARAREEIERVWLGRASKRAIRKSAQSREWHGQIVRNIRFIRKKDGSFTIVGTGTDENGREISLRGYEIALEGQRYFFWGLQRRVGRFTPREAHDLYPLSGTAQASYFSAWVEA